MGWGGPCDGYYSYNLFDTTRHLDPEDIDTSVGDTEGSHTVDYDTGFTIISYTLPIQ